MTNNGQGKRAVKPLPRHEELAVNTGREHCVVFVGYV